MYKYTYTRACSITVSSSTFLLEIVTYVQRIEYTNTSSKITISVLRIQQQYRIKSISKALLVHETPQKPFQM